MLFFYLKQRKYSCRKFNFSTKSSASLLFNFLRTPIFTSLFKNFREFNSSAFRNRQLKHLTRGLKLSWRGSFLYKTNLPRVFIGPLLRSFWKPKGSILIPENNSCFRKDEWQSVGALESRSSNCGKKKKGRERRKFTILAFSGQRFGPSWDKIVSFRRWILWPGN